MWKPLLHPASRPALSALREGKPDLVEGFMRNLAPSRPAELLPRPGDKVQRAVGAVLSAPLRRQERLNPKSSENTWDLD